jgi:hypothetical protein
MAKAGLDVVEKIDRFVENPEASQASGSEERQQEGGGHKQHKTGNK